MLLIFFSISKAVLCHFALLKASFLSFFSLFCMLFWLFLPSISLCQVILDHSHNTKIKNVNNNVNCCERGEYERALVSGLYLFAVG